MKKMEVKSNPKLTSTLLRTLILPLDRLQYSIPQYSVMAQLLTIELMRD